MGEADFEYNFKVNGVEPAQAQMMTQMFDGQQKAMGKMAQDQKALKAQVEGLQQENKELREQNERLQKTGVPPNDTLGYRAPAPSAYAATNTRDQVMQLERTIRIHEAPVHSVAMGKSSEIVATASWDQTCKLYNLKTEEVSKTLGGNEDSEQSMNGLYAVAFAKTVDDIIGCTSCDKSVYLWNHETGKMLNKLTGHSDEVNGIDFHSSQQVMATASDDCKAIIWDFQEGIVLRTLDKHFKEVYGVAFLGMENQFLLATCCFDQSTRVFDMRDKSVVSLLKMHTDDVIGIDYNGNRQMLATGSDDGTIGIWDTKQWKLIQKIDTKEVGAENEVKRVAFSPNGNWLAAACSSGNVLVYDVESPVAKQVASLGGHEDCVFDVTWGICPQTNARLLVSASHDKTCRYWREIL